MAERYTVLAQRQTSKLDDSGFGFMEVMEVTFRTTSGTTAKISVPLMQYTAERVKGEIDSYVDRIEEIAGL